MELLKEDRTFKKILTNEEIGKKINNINDKMDVIIEKDNITFKIFRETYYYKRNEQSIWILIKYKTERNDKVYNVITHTHDY